MHRVGHKNYVIRVKSVLNKLAVHLIKSCTRIIVWKIATISKQNFARENFEIIELDLLGFGRKQTYKL